MKSTISIPKPCSEDWNKMTPTDKGAYCGKCQFEVIDFTNKDPEQIREILKSRAGDKTCGHISKTQLDIVNTNYHLWNSQSSKTFRSKFLYACLMVFGMSLFTGCTSASDDHVVGDVEQPVGMVEEVGMVQEDTLNSCTIDTVCDGDILIDGMVEGEMIEEDLPE